MYADKHPGQATAAPLQRTRTDAPPEACVQGPESLFASARQILARLQQAGERLDTISRALCTEPCMDGGALPGQKDCGEPSLQALLDTAARLANEVGAVANTIACKVGQ